MLDMMHQQSQQIYLVVRLKSPNSTLSQPHDGLQANAEQAHPAEGETKPFSWTKQWYPIAAVKDLDPTRPHAEMLLGEYQCTKDERVSEDC